MSISMLASAPEITQISFLGVPALGQGQKPDGATQAAPLLPIISYLVV